MNELSIAHVPAGAGSRASGSLLLGSGYLVLYIALDWLSYVEPVRHTGITAWNPNAAIAIALLLKLGERWAPALALAIFLGEMLTVDAPAPWWAVALASVYLGTVYVLGAWGLRRKGCSRPIQTTQEAGWFLAISALTAGMAALGYVGILVGVGEVGPDEAWGSIGRYWIGEFNGIIALTPVLLLPLDRFSLPSAFQWRSREFLFQCVGAILGVGLTFALAAARDVRLFYPLFVPITWIALRRGVPGAMFSVCLVQAALVAALELTPGSVPLFDVQFPLLALGLTALFVGALATQRDVALHHIREQDATLQRAMRFSVAGQLASALTHELNQPMTALLSYVRAAELMSEPLAHADARLRGTLRKAGEEALRAAAVLRRLREFYRGEGARAERIDAWAVCVRVCDGLRNRMGRAGVELMMSAPEGLPAVMADPTQLEIVIHNLVTNSLDALEVSSAKSARARRIELRAELQGPDVLLNVEDSGPGISASVAQHLFEPFVTSKANGMGLGLSISRTFLRAQGGDLRLESGTLGGARLVIRLPTSARTPTYV